MRCQWTAFESLPKRLNPCLPRRTASRLRFFARAHVSSPWSVRRSLYMARCDWLRCLAGTIHFVNVAPRLRRNVHSLQSISGCFAKCGWRLVLAQPRPQRGRRQCLLSGGGKTHPTADMRARSGQSRHNRQTPASGPIPVRQLSRTALRKQTFKSAAVMSGSGVLAAPQKALPLQQSDSNCRFAPIQV
ncbi:hypothetical protein FHS21_005815 [Phyllobacterium trifolii]|uniref:Uncharacterized protein n=1 Tax=Phyllobacterium trifolii TaxID=300193 RepID=A0A839UKW6_9HYPH|nr:hypothetical protein [Phyllobacterium trifolii]